MMHETDHWYNNGVLAFLALALADDAIRGYKSLDDIMSARIPDGDQFWEFKYNESKLKSAVFRGQDGKPLRCQTMHELLCHLSKRAGYREKVTTHAIRRGVANAVNSQFDLSLL